MKKCKSLQSSSCTIFDTSLYESVRLKRVEKPVQVLDQAVYNMVLYFHKRGNTNAPTDATEAVGFIRGAIKHLIKARENGAWFVYGERRRGDGKKVIIGNLTEMKKKNITYAYC